MVFASFIFLFWFLPCLLPAYFAAPQRWRNLVLVLGSLVFYGWWRPQYVLLLVCTVVLAWAIARGMGAPGSTRPRKKLLVLSLASNVGLLVWFKYANLFAATWNDAAPWPLAWEQVLLPVGISFFTFQSMSYTIDVYRGNVPAERSLLDLLCFVSMFPQLVAGPILRYRDIQAQLRERTVDLVRASDGVFLVALGLAKKVLIADSIAPLVGTVWASSDPGLAASWLAACGFALQIYFDFSGYSDIAIGLGSMLGFHFPSNFLSPYRSHSITELWRRWHVSLSTWLRDYLYVPLGGNRLGEGRAQVNVAITMLLGGLWHGASWNYLLWGGWHGLWLVLERRLGKRAAWARLPVALQVVCTFVIWTLGLVIFNSQTMSELGGMSGGMLGLHGIGTLPDLGQKAPVAYGALALGTFIVFALPRSEQLVKRCHPLVMLGALACLLAAVCQLLTQDSVSFLYFRF